MNLSLGAQLQRGVIVEFDYAVLSGHQALLDVCGARLGEAGVRLDAAAMARYLGGRSFSSGLNALCNRQQKTVDVPAVIAACQAAFAERLGAALSAMPEGFTAFTGALLAKGMKVVLVTRADPEAVKAAFGDAAGDKLCVLQDVSPGFGFMGWEGWRRATRKNDLHDRLCVAVAGSGLSVKGALTAGLGTMVKLNPLVEYQDVSGCDTVIERFSGALAADVCRILRI